MKFFLTALLVLSTFSDLDKIARVNKVKKEAKDAYLNGDYESALSKYKYLTDSLQVIDDDIRLNMANAYYNLADTAQAIDNYSQLFDSKSKAVKSTAHQQMGILSSKNQKFEEALDHFKEAIKADPSNTDARYNYELMKKILKEQEEQQQQQDQQNQDQENQEDKKDQKQQNQDQQNKDQQQQNEEQQKQEEQEQQQEQEQNKEGEGEEQEKDQEQKQEEQQKEEEGEQKEEQKPKPEEGEEAGKKEGEEQQNPLSEKLEEMKITEEKAKMILEALKNKEIQYYQQNKRKPTKRKDPKKPDW
ncbi:MAG: hypothetical protein AAF843_12260 [Bacteroidota bacterium]